MKRKKEINRIIREVFNIDDTIELNEAMGPENIIGWDSVGVLNLIVVISDELNVEISIEDISEIKDIKSILSAINQDS